MKTHPSPTIKQRIINPAREKEALAVGFDPFLARIIAARPFLATEGPLEMLSPKLRTLDPPQGLADMERAVTRLVSALENQEIIGIETDHDCDGQTSHAVIYSALTTFFKHPSTSIRSYIGHRLKEGYGLSEAVAERILKDTPSPSLVITADNGSSDEIRIARLRERGIDVIVTDHHEIPQEGIPASAYAVINPTRQDSHYPDRLIAGCMVAWLFMAAVRQALIAKGKEIESVASCLDFVAVGTIADCVSIARSRNNRAVVTYGMKLIEQGLRPCWEVLLPNLSFPLSSEDLGYKIGPLLNSDGRLACAFGSVSFLLAPDRESAKRWVAHLQVQNEERKAIQKKITQLAIESAWEQLEQNKKSLCIFLEEGHAGVHGISASRIKDLFGRPVILLCPKAQTSHLLTGSARSVEGLHLREVLQAIDQNYPGILHRFGGHQGAAGLTLHRDKLACFIKAFEEIVQERLSADQIGPILLTDGAFPMEKLGLTFIKKLFSQLEPFGREFEPPVFEVTGKLLSLTPMGKTKTHARLGMAVGENWFEGVWFGCRMEAKDPWPVALGEKIKCVFSPKLQVFRGEPQLSCQVIHCEVLEWK